MGREQRISAGGTVRRSRASHLDVGFARAVGKVAVYLAGIKDNVLALGGQARPRRPSTGVW